MKTVPLPLLNRVNDKGELVLIDYPMNSDLFLSLSLILQQLIPKVVSKIYIINNNLKDDILNEFFNLMCHVNGIKTLMISKNGMGNLSSDAIVNFIRSDGFKTLTQFIIKDPTPCRFKEEHISAITSAIVS